MIQQSANAVLMIRPFRFYPNPETASDNAFQREVAPEDADADFQGRASRSSIEAVELLRGAGVTVHVFEDTASPEKPDAVFPNNWFSTHPDGTSGALPDVFAHAPERAAAGRDRRAGQTLSNQRAGRLLLLRTTRPSSRRHRKSRPRLRQSHRLRLAFQAIRPRTRRSSSARISISSRCFSRARATTAARSITPTS